MTCSAYSSRPVHGEAGVAPVARDRLPGVEPHPHLDLDAVGPAVRQQGELALDGGEERIPGAREGDEEGVALRVDFVAPVSGECSRRSC